MHTGTVRLMKIDKTDMDILCANRTDTAIGQRLAGNCPSNAELKKHLANANGFVDSYKMSGCGVRAHQTREAYNEDAGSANDIAAVECVADADSANDIAAAKCMGGYVDTTAVTDAEDAGAAEDLAGVWAPSSAEDVTVTAAKGVAAS
eukprot:scaffold602248_cov67-Attheya_sp.AAC.1